MDLSKFQRIADRMDAIGNEMREESALYAAELADRKQKGITGPMAIEHFNTWMEKAGRLDLKIK